jgi:hypothetical protein
MEQRIARQLRIDLRYQYAVDGRRTPCWLWTGAKHKQGYGRFAFNRKLYLAHRAAWMVWRGDPGELKVCHHCDREACCNVDHMFLGTQQDNMIDCARKGRWVGSTEWARSRTKAYWASRKRRNGKFSK